MMMQMDDIFGEVVQSMPVQLVEPIERMINRDVRYRPTMQYFMSVCTRGVQKVLQRGNYIKLKNLHVLYIGKSLYLLFWVCCAYVHVYSPLRQYKYKVQIGPL